MKFDDLQNFKFYLSLGFVIVLSSIFTIVFLEIIKLILKKRKVITEDIDTDKKDDMLSKIGRFVALIIYISVYFITELVTKNTIVLNEALVIGLLSGSVASLTVAKGLYTAFRQKQKKQKVYDKLSVAEKQLEKLQKDDLTKQAKIILTRKEKE